MATIKELTRLAGILERRLGFPKDKLIIRQGYGKYGLSFEYKSSAVADWTPLLSKKELAHTIRAMIDAIDYYKDRVKLKRK